MRIRWTPSAAENLQQIKEYLNEHNPGFAESTVLEIYEAVKSLKALPRRGRIGRVEGTRELVLLRLPYIVVYRVHEEAVEILHIWHAAQNRP